MASARRAWKRLVGVFLSNVFVSNGFVASVFAAGVVAVACGHQQKTTMPSLPASPSSSAARAPTVPPPSVAPESPIPAAPTPAALPPAAAPVPPALTAAPVAPAPTAEHASIPETPPLEALSAGDTATAPPGTPLALRPGAAEMVRQRLEAAGVLRAQQVSGQPAPGEMSASVRSALARFQEANHLPPTGELDEATALKLGLHPKNIFEPAPGLAE